MRASSTPRTEDDVRDSSHTPVAPPNSHLPRVWPPVCGIIWLSAGPLFMAHSAHFGVGFLPAMAWLITLPLLTCFYVVATIVQLLRWRSGAWGERFRVWRLLGWGLAALAYAVVTATR